MTHLEVKRSNPEIAGTGGGAGGERAVVDFENAIKDGHAGVHVSMDTKKNIWGGRLRQHSWSLPVLDEAECLLVLLGNQPLASSDPPTQASESGRAVVLPDGTPVKLRLYRFVNSGRVREGSVLPFVVMEDVVKDGVVLVRRGAVGKGSITSLEGRSSYFRDARCHFQVDSVRAIDGQEIRLRSTQQGVGSRGAGRTAAAAAYWRLYGLWLKGNEKGIRAGILVVGYAEGERQLRLP